MEGLGLPRVHALPLVWVLVAVLGQGSGGTACPSDDYSPREGVCCDKCQPGFKLLEPCSATGQRSRCVPCPPRQFRDLKNFFPNCKQCRRCKETKHEYKVSNCTSEKDTVCECVKGYYRSEVNVETYQCRKCSQCSSDEEEKHTCSPQKDTVCECKKNFYRVDKKCQPCKNCSGECLELCTSAIILTTAANDPGKDFLVNLIAGVGVLAVVLLVLVVLITYLFTKRFTKKKLLTTPAQPVDSSLENTTFLISQEESLCPPGLDAVLEVQVIQGGGHQSSNLPDCVPPEINVSELIYTVLDLVSVPQVKQLVRLLGVRDTEIEEAEVDYRRCREANYQMLRIWAERGAGGAGGVGQAGVLLHGPLLEELLEKLRVMSLGGVAEELDIKFGIQ